MRFNLFDNEEDILPQKKKPRLLFGNTPQFPPFSVDDDEKGSQPPTQAAPPTGLNPDLRPADNYVDDTSATASQPKKQSFFSKLFLGEKTGGGMDEYGLERPQSRKIGILGALLGALPATIYGASNGLGLAGLGAGLGAAGNLRKEQDEQSLKDYQTERAEKIKANKPSTFQQNLQDYMAFSPEQKSAFQEMQSIKNPLGAMNYNLSLEKFKSDEEDRKNKKLKESMGEKLPAGQAVLLADGATIPALLNNLESTLDTKKDVGGPIEGRIVGINPYDTSAQDFQSQLNATKQFVGKFLEGGVLRKEDESKYDKIMPLITDTPDVRKKKLLNLRKMVQDKYNEYIDSFQKAGYNVSNFSKLNTSQPTQNNQAALEWARQNSNDPRAQKILQHLGAQ